MAKPIKELGAFSYSQYKTFNDCPMKFKLKHLDKIPEPPHPNMDRGTAIHLKGEHFLRGNIRGVPPEYKPFAEKLRRIKRMGALPEVDLAITREWEPTTYNDWGGVWCRAQADALYIPEDGILSIVDYKTGGIYPDHADQAHLYATLGLSHYDGVKEVKVEFWYLDKEEDQDFVFPAKHYPRMQKAWEQRYNKMKKEKKFDPPNDAPCYRCSYNPAKGGQCPKGG